MVFTSWLLIISNHPPTSHQVGMTTIYHGMKPERRLFFSLDHAITLGSFKVPQLGLSPSPWQWEHGVLQQLDCQGIPSRGCFVTSARSQIDLRTDLFLMLGLLKISIYTYPYVSGYERVFWALLGHYPCPPASWKCLKSACTQFPVLRVVVRAFSQLLSVQTASCASPTAGTLCAFCLTHRLYGILNKFAPAQAIHSLNFLRRENIHYWTSHLALFICFLIPATKICCPDA